MIADYKQNGFYLVKDRFGNSALSNLEDVILRFHEKWRGDNVSHYRAGAVNSAYLTGTKYLEDEDRMVLFKFITTSMVLDILQEIIPDSPAFMNTQLFFNPFNLEQKNYWHRDIQYNDYSVEYQKKAIKQFNVVHFRIPLRSEPGLEVIPGSHNRWDTDEEYHTRMQKNGRKNSDELKSSCRLQPGVGDLLVFSANMIHRGIYGGTGSCLISCSAIHTWI
jgi:ectoine hydroxylase-related dioxygenase (phytanoyl-CoA dioxygenase family)